MLQKLHLHMRLKIKLMSVVVADGYCDEGKACRVLDKLVKITSMYGIVWGGSKEGNTCIQRVRFCAKVIQSKILIFKKAERENQMSNVRTNAEKKPRF